jgi:hypothetical protein
MNGLTDVASAVRPASLVRPPNEALQLTRSALTTIAAALAAERRCWADFSGLGAPGVPC